MRVGLIKCNYFTPAAFKVKVHGKGEAGKWGHLLVQSTQKGALLTDGPPPNKDVGIRRPVASL